MGEIFRNIRGNLNGYGLENSKFNPQSDDSDINSFFDQKGENSGTIYKGQHRQNCRGRKTTSDMGRNAGDLGLHRTAR